LKAKDACSSRLSDYEFSEEDDEDKQQSHVKLSSSPSTCHTTAVADPDASLLSSQRHHKDRSSSSHSKHQHSSSGAGSDDSSSQRHHKHRSSSSHSKHQHSSSGAGSDDSSSQRHHKHRSSSSHSKHQHSSSGAGSDDFSLGDDLWALAPRTHQSNASNVNTSAALTALQLTSGKRVKWTEQEINFVGTWCNKTLRENLHNQNFIVARCLQHIRSSDKLLAIFHPHHILTSGRLKHAYDKFKEINGSQDST
jgi:hypothetical protein